VGGQDGRKTADGPPAKTEDGCTAGATALEC